jgi:DNA-binding CsgD family transcriptional regulator
LAAADARLLELVGDVQGLLDLDDLRQGMVGALRRAVGSDWVSMNEFGPEPGDVWSLVDPPVPAELVESFARYAHQNPLVEYCMSSRRGSPRRISDFLTRRELHALELYREVYAPIGLEYQVAFTLPQRPPRMLGVALSRKRRDFSDAEREFLGRARPFLIQAYRNAVAHQTLREASGERGLDAALLGAGLTRRQAEAVRLVAMGRSNAAAAAELGISARTVDKHLELAFERLGVHSRSEAAERAWSLARSAAPGDAPTA